MFWSSTYDFQKVARVIISKSWVLLLQSDQDTVGYVFFPSLSSRFLIAVIFRQSIQWFPINPLNKKRRLLYLKTQFIPRSKHFPLGYKN